MASSCPRVAFAQNGRAYEGRCPSGASEIELAAPEPPRLLARPWRVTRTAFGAAVAAALVMGCGSAPRIVDRTSEAKQAGARPPNPRDPETTRADEENHERLHDDNTNVMKP